MIVTLFISLNTGLSSSSTANKDVEITHLERIPYTPYGSTLRISVTIRNSGSMPITYGDKLKVMLCIDGSWKTSTRVSTLGVGESKTVTLKYKPESIGTHRYNVNVKARIDGKKTTLANSGSYDLRVYGSGRDCYYAHFNPCYEDCMDECISDTVWRWDIENIELDVDVFDYASLESEGGGKFKPKAIHPIMLEDGELDLLQMKKNFKVSCYIEIRYVDYEDRGPDPSGSYKYEESGFRKLGFLPPTGLEYG